MYPLNKIVPPIAYSRSIVCEKGMKSPTIPVIPTAIQQFVNRRSEGIEEVPTESDESAEEPRPHAGKVILGVVRRMWARFRVRHTLD